MWLLVFLLLLRLWLRCFWWRRLGFGFVGHLFAGQVGQRVGDPRAVVDPLEHQLALLGGEVDARDPRRLGNHLRGDLRRAFGQRDQGAAEDGVAEAGGTPLEFPSIAVCDGIATGHRGMKMPMPSRELIADSSISPICKGSCFIHSCALRRKQKMGQRPTP